MAPRELVAKICRGCDEVPPRRRMVGRRRKFSVISGSGMLQWPKQRDRWPFCARKSRRRYIL